MRDFIDFGGTTPPDEDCAQVGSREYDYANRAKREARAYIRLLRRTLGDEPDGASLSVKSHPHDFGTYFTVVCYFEPDDADAADYAARCESKGPSTWDVQAFIELSPESNTERSVSHEDPMD